MRCPHCSVAFIDRDHKVLKVEEFENESYYIIARICPTCKKIVVELSLERIQEENIITLLGNALTGGKSVPRRRPFREWATLVWPRGVARESAPEEVPEEYSKDYEEACLVLSAGSANASAALSRRCLQNILRNELGVSKPTLYKEIEEVISDPATHSEVKGSLHYLRQLGNLAAHPMQSGNTGEIVDVDEGEAEWCLDVIEILFEIYFVRPAKDDEMRKAIAAKIAKI